MIESLIHLVTFPQPEHPLRADLAEEYSKDRVKFMKNAEEFTKKHSEKRPVDWHWHFFFVGVFSFLFCSFFNFISYHDSLFLSPKLHRDALLFSRSCIVLALSKKKKTSLLHRGLCFCFHFAKKNNKKSKKKKKAGLFLGWICRLWPLGVTFFFFFFFFFGLFWLSTDFFLEKKRENYQRWHPGK